MCQQCQACRAIQEDESGQGICINYASPEQGTQHTHMLHPVASWHWLYSVQTRTGGKAPAPDPHQVKRPVHSRCVCGPTLV